MKTSNSMSGLNRMKYRLKGLILIMMSLFPTLNPAETTTGRELPSAEFIEFLIEWETDQGEWAGPELFVDDSFDQLFEDEENAEDDIEEVEDAE